MPEDIQPSTLLSHPPTSEDDRVLWLRLLRSRRVGPSTFYRLIDEYGSVRSAFEALPEVARKAGVEKYNPCSEEAAMQEWTAAHSHGARMTCITDAEYPEDLKQISDAPPFLWSMGKLSTLNLPIIALVGARNASSLGLRMARALAADLAAQGFIIVSGLARGIDTAAHTASLATGTIAIQAGGVDIMYPAENTHLAEKIAETGLRLSEQPMGLQPQARHFPRRNRLISGIARAVVVIEAAAKSGSLLTARNALDQGREVLAVPGHPFDARASGCNMLLRDGARLVRNAEDVIEALPPKPTTPTQNDLPLETPATPKRSLQDTAQLHSQILNRLGPSPLAEDQLIRDLATPAATVSPVLTDLELDGKVTRHPGGLLSLTV
ncbi:hypothetical protein ROA7450_00680 [Roseovarius albus]|uniref:Uncharacterized protein n=1 Tax=Roseovarius albus TaxID=1247867 RepID=A0A1X6YFS3_9RHOB|nr:DNA-processing protein DprA [Roseovarius albus]SLN20305.1 hypothetical protein ROA7450_00680 [Roseovarius albus]